MKLVPNIDMHGRLARGVCGIVLLLLAIGLLIAYWPAGLWLWLVAILLFLSGGFCIFEAMMGWCGMRALNIKTPL